MRRVVFGDFLFFGDAATQFGNFALFCGDFGAEVVVFLPNFGIIGAEFGYFPLMENFVDPVEYQLCPPDFLR